MALWIIENELIAHAEHMDRMESKEFNQIKLVKNKYYGNVDTVNDSYNFPQEKYVDVEVQK